MSHNYHIPTLPLAADLETREILRQVNLASRRLAELKGVANVMPNEDILLQTLTLQEAKDSSAIENIVTTQDEIFKAELSVKEFMVSIATKEVLNYRAAMQEGFREVRRSKLLTNKTILHIQERLEKNNAGFRALPGTTLQNAQQEVVYTPPQSAEEVKALMANLEKFINEPDICELDPLIKLAIIHHQFESIHPFYDGNGRTGRIVIVLYLVLNDLLDLPILYLSRYINRHKVDYYRRLQAVRDSDGAASDWQAWILFILKGIEETAQSTIQLVNGIADLMTQFKQKLRPLFGRLYKHELLNNLFFHPYTKIEFVARDMQVHRHTAQKYLDKIVDKGLLRKVKVSRSNYYVNMPLCELFIRQGHTKEEAEELIKSFLLEETKG